MTIHTRRRPLLGAVALAASVTLLGACGSSKKSADTTVAAAPETTAAAAAAPETTGAAAPAPETTAAAAAAPETTGAAAAASEDTMDHSETTAAGAAAPADTAAAAPADTAAAAAPAGDAAAANTYTLAEWSLTGNATLPAGPIELTVVNGGKMPHELLVFKGTTYEDAPKNEKGTVLEDQLPAGSKVGEVERILPGASEKLSLTLEPGKYLFVCNIEFGPTSHAGKGQRLNVTVA